MPRYVVLEHCHEGVHWDFMLESAGGLRTWRLALAPRPELDIAATPLSDHRLEYLEYEGEVSRGRGHVTRWDTGVFDWIVDNADGLCMRLQGQNLRGYATIARQADGAWLFRLATSAE